MAVEQFFEGVTVTGHVGRQQFGIAALVPHPASEPHGRTVTNTTGPGTSPNLVPQEADLTVISEIAVRLLPSVVPSVEIHTSKFDVGDDALTGMTLWPGCINVG